MPSRQAIPSRLHTPTEGHPAPEGARSLPRDPKSPEWPKFELLDLDLCACLFELLLQVSCFVLGNGLLERLGGAFDQVLGFLEAQAGDLTHDLDDVDLLRTSVSEDHVELGLLFLGGGSSATTSSDASDCNRCSTHAPLRLELLHQFGDLDDGQVGQVIDHLVFANFGH